MKYVEGGDGVAVKCPACKHNSIFKQPCNYTVNEKVSLAIKNNEFEITSHSIDEVEIKSMEHYNNFVCSLCGKSFFIYADHNGKESLKEGE